MKLKNTFVSYKGIEYFLVVPKVIIIYQEFTCSGPLIDRFVVVKGSAIYFLDLFLPPSLKTCQSFNRNLWGRSNSLANLMLDVLTPIGIPNQHMKEKSDNKPTKEAFKVKPDVARSSQKALIF